MSDDVATEPDTVDGAPGEGEQGPPEPLRLIRAPDVLEEDVRPLFDSPSVRLVRARVVESLEQARVDIDTARREAEAIVEEARSQAEQVREQARHDGHAEGLEEVVEHIARARREYTETMEAAEDDMLELAARLARRIVGEAIEVEPQRVQKMVAQVLRHARGKREIVVHVAAEDLAALEGHAAEFSRQVDGVPVHFDADPSLERGSCVIQTESGRIDGRITTQLQTLLRALRGG
jgi:type III secretion protein L